MIVQYRVKSEDSAKAFFGLDDPVGQIDSFIKNEVRSRVPKMKLDELFESPDAICDAISSKLGEKMQSHGFSIENTLVTTIDPDVQVMKAMNQINASERMKKAWKKMRPKPIISNKSVMRRLIATENVCKEKDSQQRKKIMKGYSNGVLNLSKNFGMTHSQIVDLNCTQDTALGYDGNYW